MPVAAASVAEAAVSGAERLAMPAAAVAAASVPEAATREAVGAAMHVGAGCQRTRQGPPLRCANDVYRSFCQLPPPRPRWCPRCLGASTPAGAGSSTSRLCGVLHLPFQRRRTLETSLDNAQSEIRPEPVHNPAKLQPIRGFLR